MTADAAVAAAYARAIARSGRTVTIQRVTGSAPRTGLISATVPAAIGVQSPDGADPARAGYGSGQMGGIAQDTRQIVVLAADLAARRFPLPVQSGDRVLLGDDRLEVSAVDAEKRALAGAIEIQASGVSA